MANSPIQVVLNSNDFVGAWDRTPGGVNKDFYAGNDGEFIAHKKNISSQLSILKDSLVENEFSQISYAKLVLKQSALAKTHRPTSVLFSKNIAPVVGAGDLGELFVQIQPDSIEKITSKIESAEEVTRYKKNNEGKNIPNPSAVRSEIGSIEEIKPYIGADKRNFTLTEGVTWLSNPQTGGAYIIELFETPLPRQDWDRLPIQKFRLFKSFIDGLISFGNGMVTSRLANSDLKTSMIGIRLEESGLSANVQLTPTQSAVKRQDNVRQIVVDLNKHAELLQFLENHPLVKKIILPPIITKSNSTISSPPFNQNYILPIKVKGKTYPKVCVVDGGVSNYLKDWVVDSWGLLSANDKDEEHGTFIGGILLSGNKLNGVEICKEIDGCDIVDLDLLPKSQFFANYYTKPLEFFKELELAVKDLKARIGARIFNFSLNIEEHVSSSGYSPAAKMLDRIAEENDVIFIISAGNTSANDFRKEWPIDPVEALGILASSRNDIIKTPAESCRNLSVSALNPPNIEGIVPYAPSNYTCRGPGMRVGLKPDLAHIGGAGTKSPNVGYGLFSINSKGSIVDGCGTSYAAPNVAKILACIEHEIEGNVSRETLMGLVIHHAALPKILADRTFCNVAKHLAGFGVPNSSEEILKGNDSSITLVFATRIYQGMKMSFNFSWPPSLIKEGKCFGKARLTIVSTPPFDYRYGAEFVRVNIDGHLRQEQEDGKYKGMLSSIYLPQNAGNKLYEKNQIDHAFKWSPVKVSEKVFKKGVGRRTNWRLDVDYLTRDGETVPVEGIPFTAILTISNPNGDEPVFNEMRQNLQALGVKILDIKTAARVIPRV